MADEPSMSTGCSLVPSVLCCFAFSLSQDWELPAKREVSMWFGWSWHWICQEGCGAIWAEEVTCGSRVVPAHD